MTKTETMTHTDAIRATLARGETCSVPYHVESYGPGRVCHSWGAPVIGEAAGPEGFLLLGLSESGEIVIDESDADVCPEQLQGALAGEGGQVIVSAESPLDRARAALDADGYEISQSSTDDRLYLSVTDEGGNSEEGDDALDNIRKIVQPFGCWADWTGSGNTDARGHSTSDIAVRVVDDETDDDDDLDDSGFPRDRGDGGTLSSLGTGAVRSNKETMTDETTWNAVLGPYATPVSVIAEAESQSITPQAYITDAIRQAVEQGADLDRDAAFAELCRQVGVTVG